MTVSKIIANCVLLVPDVSPIPQGSVSRPYSLTADIHEDNTLTCLIDGKQQMFQTVSQLLDAWNGSQTRKFIMESWETAEGRHPLGRADREQASTQRRRESLQD